MGKLTHTIVVPIVGRDDSDDIRRIQDSLVLWIAIVELTKRLFDSQYGFDRKIFSDSENPPWIPAGSGDNPYLTDINLISYNVQGSFTNRTYVILAGMNRKDNALLFGSRSGAKSIAAKSSLVIPFSTKSPRG